MFKEEHALQEAQRRQLKAANQVAGKSIRKCKAETSPRRRDVTFLQRQVRDNVNDDGGNDGAGGGNTIDGGGDSDSGDAEPKYAAIVTDMLQNN